MAKKLKIWNGRTYGKYRKFDTTYVAAYSQKQAVEIIEKACGLWLSANEIRNYFSPCWGNSMKGIVPTEPCVYVSHYSDKEPPLKIYPNEQ